MLVWTSQNGDVNVPGIAANGTITAGGVTGQTAIGTALLTAANAAAAAQVVAPGSTVISAAATTAIAALTSLSTAADIVAALQA